MNLSLLGSFGFMYSEGSFSHLHCRDRLAMCYETYIKLKSILHICLFHHNRNIALGVKSCCADGSAEAPPCPIWPYRTRFGLVG